MTAPRFVRLTTHVKKQGSSDSFKSIFVAIEKISLIQSTDSGQAVVVTTNGQIAVREEAEAVLRLIEQAAHA